MGYHLQQNSYFKIISGIANTCELHQPPVIKIIITINNYYKTRELFRGRTVESEVTG